MHTPDIIFLSETWLNKDVEDSSIFPGNQYMILSRSERARGNHGGVLFAANYSFYSVTEIKEVSLPEFNFTAALQIKTGNFYLLIVGVYYLPADSAYRPSM